MNRLIFIMRCRDQAGIVARVTQYFYSIGANLDTMDQHNSGKEGEFFLRGEFSFSDEKTASEVEAGFKPLAKTLAADYHIYDKSEKLRMGVLVSRNDHVLYDILYRWKTGEWQVEIPWIAGNHEGLRYVADMYGIPFHFIPVDKHDRSVSETKILEIAKDTDFLVLARYMQILTADFIGKFSRDIINIHHSFLPSFKGANPYRQAYERGVKVIGATAHFVNDDLDEGPIIEQMVERISHRDLEEDLKHKGKNLEKLAMASAIEAYIERRILRYGTRTIVFSD